MAKKPAVSQFAGLKLLRDKPVEANPEQLEIETPEPAPKKRRTTAKPDAVVVESQPVARRPGRPPGMKSDPNFRVTSIVLNTDIANAVRARLGNTPPVSMSVLINDLLYDWVSSSMENQPLPWETTEYIEERLAHFKDQLTKK